MSRVGLVVHYAFLWSHEHDAGREEGRYARPCLVLLDSPVADSVLHRVTVAPVTTVDPGDAPAVPVPRRVRAALGLDADESWIVPTEANEFLWPGPDLQPTPDGRADYGYAPPALLAQVRDAMIDALESRSLRRIRRTS